MTLEFRDAVRQDVPLLILLAGGTGSGKTESALRLATGLAAGGLIVGIDTERGRMLHKADDYTFKHAELEPKFTPERYADALTDAAKLDPAVIVLDSGSHEYDGDGGVLDIQTDEFERMGRKDSARMASWIVPKSRHKTYVRELLRAKAHVIVCHRAEDKVEIVKDAEGRTVIRPKASLVGAEGWVPICERRLPFEATLSLLLTQDAPGIPKPIKLEGRHVDLIPLDQQLSEDIGARLAEWAAGSQTGPRGPAEAQKTHEEHDSTGTGASTITDLIALSNQLLDAGKEAGRDNLTLVRAIEKNAQAHVDRPDLHEKWLRRQLVILDEDKAGAKT